MKEETKTILKVAFATAVWCAVHSLFAARKVKQTVRIYTGEENYLRYYRPFYSLQSVGTLILLGTYLRRLPDREVFHNEGKTADLIRLGEGIAFSYFAWGAYRAKIGRLSGIEPMLAANPHEQEGQTPTVTPDGALDLTGIARHSRHALNFAAVPLLWLFPRLGLKHVTFSAIATLYLWLGSFHEEARQRHLYGERYVRYREAGTPFFIPNFFRSFH